MYLTIRHDLTIHPSFKFTITKEEYYRGIPSIFQSGFNWKLHPAAAVFILALEGTRSIRRG